MIIKITIKYRIFSKKPPDKKPRVKKTRTKKRIKSKETITRVKHYELNYDKKDSIIKSALINYELIQNLPKL